MIHPVLKHILARNNQEVPINDGRKIALVLFGGVMRGIRGGGAMAVLEQLGLSQAFDYIFAASAGVPNACYLLTDNTKIGLSVYCEDLCQPQFLKFSRIWNIADINHVIETIKHKKVLDIDKLYDVKSKLYIRVKNITKQQNEYLEIHKYSKEQFYDIFRAAISMQYLQRDSVKIGTDNYRDADFRFQASPDHVRFALKSDATDILIIYNHFRQNIWALPASDRVFEIMTPRTDRLSKFERNPEKLRAASERMRRRVMKAFAKTEEVNLILPYI